MYCDPSNYARLQADHAAMVSALAKPGAEIVLTAENAHLLHMTLGISGEAGELIDAVKRMAIYGKELDMKNVVEDLGDLEFFLQGLRAGLGISRSETLRANMEKLSKRYPAGIFTNTDTIARADKVGER